MSRARLLRDVVRRRPQTAHENCQRWDGERSDGVTMFACRECGRRTPGPAWPPTAAAARRFHRRRCRLAGAVRRVFWPGWAPVLGSVREAIARASKFRDGPSDLTPAVESDVVYTMATDLDAPAQSRFGVRNGNVLP